jgi:hypothetical protein
MLCQYYPDPRKTQGGSVEKHKRYQGIHRDPKGAMNPTGNIIRDAWVFGLIPETETCEGWTVQGIDQLYDKVYLEWEKYGHQVSALPFDLQERHKRIYDQAIERARLLGWSSELGDES